MTKILGMGQYGIYVWPAFIIAALVISGMLAMTLCSLRRAHKTLRELQANPDAD